MASVIKNEIRELENLKSYNLVEFHHQLRNLLGRSYEHDLYMLIEVLDAFYKDIVRNGIFYIDVFNSILYFFFTQSPKNAQGVVSVFKIISSICDRSSLKMITGLIKKLQSRKELELAQELIKVKVLVQDRIKSIEEKITELSLSPPKGIIDEWF